MSKKSTLKDPRYEFKKSKEKAHKMSFTVTVSKTMITYMIYDMMCVNHLGNRKHEFYFFRNKEEVDINDITCQEIEAELRYVLKYQGLDFFDKEDRDQSKQDKAEEIAQLKFPKYFKNNSLNFIME